MQIILGEDDAIFHGGVPKNIVVTVTMDDGKKVKFPYSAEKSMSSLYEDIRNFCPSAPEHKGEVVPSVRSEFKIPPRDESKDRQLVISDPNKIEREDIVRCVVLEKRESSCDLKVGGEYRVLKAIRKDIPTADGKIQTVYDGYEVIDDTSASPIRTFVFPHEVQLLRKRTPPPEKISNYEEIVICAECKEPSALVLDKEKDKYVGECVKCGKPMEKDRVKQPDQTAQ